ncbi:MAG: tRNA preQ1(34) S-adenosylmethionine ribosyltransferase-isomerase QueA [Planctomycetes bacterium]|nr:tRNA preQ1(34) S-adenosylmethionine ribosyltransferase-isomerase QueA [Planctomycetota bacterium]
MRLEEFDYRLPKERIAQEPLPQRDASRLLIQDRGGGSIRHGAFPDLIAELRPDDLLVLNDTRVVPARLVCFRETGGRVDALIVGRLGDRRREALLDTSRKLKTGERLKVGEREWARIAGKEADRWVLEFDSDPEAIVAARGRMPLPPYIRREADDRDRERYQTVYAAKEGAIAAPTAGLHFTPEILARLPCPVARLTLHVGTGTFKPVKCENVEEHVLDPERFEIPDETVAAVRRARRVVAVGTTVCRTLETWARTGETSGTSGLFIHPPFEFKVVGALLTNFHLPKSTLLMLVCAFAGRERVLAAYAEAIERGYRFFSYGDAMLLK